MEGIRYMPLTHKFTLMADDVRIENNGKPMILGMYMGSVTVGQLPFSMPSLTFFQVFEIDRPEDHFLRIQLQNLETGRQLAQAIMPMQNARPGTPIVNIIKFGNIQFERSGSYQLTTTIDEGRDPIIFPFDVVLVINQPQQPPR
jgi:hypothetical protein